MKSQNGRAKYHRQVKELNPPLANRLDVRCYGRSIDKGHQCRDFVLKRAVFVAEFLSENGLLAANLEENCSQHQQESDERSQPARHQSTTERRCDKARVDRMTDEAIWPGAD